MLTSSLIKPLLFYFLVVASIFIVTQTANATETTLVIRAKSKDAKFIGTSMGGARIVVRNNLTGKILAEGITEGSTGDTELIMKGAHRRGERISTENTAAFVAVLDIDEPVFVSIEAYAPLDKKHAIVSSSTQMWVIPGKDILGDGIIIELPGFVIDILNPASGQTLSKLSSEITLKAKIVMLCGCPITEGGLWDANQYEVEAIVSKEGEVIKKIPLTIVEEESIFQKQVTLPPGNYEVKIYAFDPVSGNTGLAEKTFSIQ